MQRAFLGPHIKIPTGISGLDRMLHGGLLPGRPYLVVGPPGAGKTTLALEFLLRGVRQGEEVLYVTLEEPPNELRVEFAGLGGGEGLDRIWVFDAIPDVMRYEKTPFKDIAAVRSATRLGDVAPEIRRTGEFTSVEITFSALMQTLKMETVRRLYSRIVIDSLTALQFFCMKGFDEAQGAQAFLRFLSDLKITSILTVETPATDRPTAERLLARGEIHLFRWEIDGGVVRAVGIEKIRGSGHDPRLHPFRLSTHGLDVDTSVAVSRETHTVVPVPSEEPETEAEPSETELMIEARRAILTIQEDVQDLLDVGVDVDMVREMVQQAHAALSRMKTRESLRLLLEARQLVNHLVLGYQVSQEFAAKGAGAPSWPSLAVKREVEASLGRTTPAPATAAAPSAGTPAPAGPSPPLSQATRESAASLLPLLSRLVGVLGTKGSSSISENLPPALLQRAAAVAGAQGLPALQALAATPETGPKPVAAAGPDPPLVPPASTTKPLPAAVPPPPTSSSPATPAPSRAPPQAVPHPAVVTTRPSEAPSKPSTSSSPAAASPLLAPVGTAPGAASASVKPVSAPVSAPSAAVPRAAPPEASAVPSPTASRPAPAQVAGSVAKPPAVPAPAVPGVSKPPPAPLPPSPKAPAFAPIPPVPKMPPSASRPNPPGATPVPPVSAPVSPRPAETSPPLSPSGTGPAVGSAPAKPVPATVPPSPVPPSAAKPAPAAPPPASTSPAAAANSRPPPVTPPALSPRPISATYSATLATGNRIPSTTGGLPPGRPTTPGGSPVAHAPGSPMGAASRPAGVQGSGRIGPSGPSSLPRPPPFGGIREATRPSQGSPPSVPMRPVAAPLPTPPPVAGAPPASVPSPSAEPPPQRIPPGSVPATPAATPAEAPVEVAATAPGSSAPTNGGAPPSEVDRPATPPAAPPASESRPPESAVVPEDQQPPVAQPKLQVPTALPAPARPSVPEDASAAPPESAELKESPGPAAPTAATEAPSTPTAEATLETSIPEEGAKRKGGRRKKGAAGSSSLGKRKKKATLVDETVEAPAASESGAASETPPSALPSQEGSEHDTTSTSEEPPSDAEPAMGPSSSGDGDS